MNKVSILENKVIKQFSDRKRFQTELDMRENFTGSFKIPEILRLDEQTLMIEFERIDITPLDTFVNSFDLEGILGLIEMIPKLKGERTRKDQKLYLLSKVKEDYLQRFLQTITLNSNSLMHGDFRMHNLLRKGKDIYLIDFEFSGYGEPERDMAYLYSSILYFNKKLGQNYLEFIQKQPNYPLFLFYCLFYNCAAGDNPQSNKEVLSMMKEDIVKEIKKNCL